jgi:pyruvate,water dikinase
LAKWCVDIEKHYSKIHGHDTPMYIEWAKDGKSEKLYIVQARPETVRSRQNENKLSQTIVTKHGKSAIEGTAIGSDAASGRVRVIDRLEDIATMQPGDILVTGTSHFVLRTTSMVGPLTSYPSASFDFLLQI